MSLNVTKEIGFEIRGHEVAPSDSLVVRNFHFYRSEDDTNPLADPAFGPGDSIWAKFDITGYTFGPGNNVDVSDGVAVLSSEGKLTIVESPVRLAVAFEFTQSQP